MATGGSESWRLLRYLDAAVNAIDMPDCDRSEDGTKRGLSPFSGRELFSGSECHSEETSSIDRVTPMVGREEKKRAQRSSSWR